MNGSIYIYKYNIFGFFKMRLWIHAYIHSRRSIQLQLDLGLWGLRKELQKYQKAWSTSGPHPENDGKYKSNRKEHESQLVLWEIWENLPDLTILTLFWFFPFGFHGSFHVGWRLGPGSRTRGMLYVAHCTGSNVCCDKQQYTVHMCMHVIDSCLQTQKTQFI